MVPRALLGLGFAFAFASSVDDLLVAGRVLAIHG